MNFEKYQIKELAREDIHLADYNPRLIKQDNKNKIKRNIKKYGMLQPIIVNKTTGNVVAGNQRLQILDELHKEENYKITVAEIECSAEDEVKLNIFLNNQSASGEYDTDMLHSIFEEFKDIDPIKDAGFDKIDLEFMFDGIDFENSAFFNTESHKEAKTEIDKIANSDKLREYKKKTRENIKNGGVLTRMIEKEDCHVIFVFNSNEDKRRFNKAIKVDEKEKFLSYKKLYDILDPKYQNF